MKDSGRMREPSPAGWIVAFVCLTLLLIPILSRSMG